SLGRRRHGAAGARAGTAGARRLLFARARRRDDLPAAGPWAEPDPRLHRHAVAGPGRAPRNRRLCVGAAPDALRHALRAEPGLGGSLYAHYETVVSPLVFQMYYSNTILIIVLGGGVGRVPGAIIGSFLFVAVTEALRVAPELRMIIYGFVLLVLVFVFPQGLAPLIERATERLPRLGATAAKTP